MEHPSSEGVDNTEPDGYPADDGVPDIGVVNSEGSGISKSESPVWGGFQPWRGSIKTNGLSGAKKRYYEWDYTHSDIEVYNQKGKHLGSMDPITKKMTKPAVPGRKIDI